MASDEIVNRAKNLCYIFLRDLAKSIDGMADINIFVHSFPVYDDTGFIIRNICVASYQYRAIVYNEITDYAKSWSLYIPMILELDDTLLKKISYRAAVSSIIKFQIEQIKHTPWLDCLQKNIIVSETKSLYGKDNEAKGLIPIQEFILKKGIQNNKSQ